MNNLTRLLTLLNEDLPSKSRFRTLDIEGYKERYEEYIPSCQEAKVPKFFSEGINIGQMEGELQSNYIELYIDNAGYKQNHEYLLTSVLYNKYKKCYTLAFTGEYSNWAPKRIVSISGDYKTIIRNDFKDVYSLSWQDYKEKKYQKASKKIAPKLGRSTLTEIKK